MSPPPVRWTRLSAPIPTPAIWPRPRSLSPLPCPAPPAPPPVPGVPALVPPASAPPPAQPGAAPGSPGAHGLAGLLHGFITTNIDGEGGGMCPGTPRRSRTRHTAWAAPGSAGTRGAGVTPNGLGRGCSPCPPLPRGGPGLTPALPRSRGALRPGKAGRATAMYRGSDSKGLCSVSTKYTSVVSFICRLEPQTPRPGPHRHVPVKTRHQPLPTARKHAQAVPKPRGCEAPRCVPGRARRGPATRAGSGPAHERLCSSSRCRRVCSKRRGCVGLPVPRTGSVLVKSDEPG